MAERAARAGDHWLAVVVVLVLAIVGAVALLAVTPPRARSADAPEGEFSAARAAVHVDQIAQRPHPVGSADHARVQRYIVEAARDAGAEVRVESDEAIRVASGSPFRSARTENVVARLAGSAPSISGGKVLMVAAHYDSVPTGPGAADDGAAVAAMLETMRALRVIGGVRNDVVFLFTDGEELGLLGAAAFVERHGVDDIGAVLNWEARGSRGPVWMFETSGGNGPLVRAFADATARPVANSLSYEVYRRLPNDTDFTVFREAGAAGLNSAFIDGVHDYHAASDTPQRLSADSMQHHGENMLGMVRVFGNADLRTYQDGSDAVYFDVFARGMVRYPAALVVPVAVLTVLALAGLIVFGARRSAVHPASVLVVAAVGIGAVVLTAVACVVLWRLVLLVRPELGWLPLSEPYRRAGFAAGFALVALAWLLVAARLLHRRGGAELLAGGLAVLAVPLLVFAFAVPGASYLFQWPVLAGLPALWWTMRRGDHGPMPSGIPAVVMLVLFTPLVTNLLVALGMRLAGVAMAIGVLGGLVMLPLLARLPRPGLTAAIGASIGVVVLGVSVASSASTPQRPRQDALVYVQDAAEGRALWLTGDPAPDAWTVRVLGDRPERADPAPYLPEFAGRSVLTAAAPTVGLPAPTVSVIADTTTGDARTVRFRVASTRRAWRLQVRLPVEPLRTCTVAGQRIDAPVLAKGAAETNGVVFLHYGAGSNGMELSCEIRAGTQLTLDVSDYDVGLPTTVAALVGPRPAATVPAAHNLGPSDSSVVRQSFVL